MKSYPILYSFRRCPYAMRARYALAYKGMQCELREVHLKRKPQALLDASAKGTVPVMQLPDGTIIDESLDIISYAFHEKIASPLITCNDTVFAKALHMYKYHDRYPADVQYAYRTLCHDIFLREIEQRLSTYPFVKGTELTAEDIAIFPHIRQFSMVEPEWFATSHYRHITRWLGALYNHPIYEIIMKKQIPWQEGDAITMML